MGKWIYQSNEVDETKIKLKMEKWINELKQQGNYVKMEKKISNRLIFFDKSEISLMGQWSFKTKF